MGEVDPLAIVQCCSCFWWWYLFDRTPTEPFVCPLCKQGQPPWEDIPYRRRETPAYGRIAMVSVKGTKKKR